jgi:general secretion pathway protein D
VVWVRNLLLELHQGGTLLVGIDIPSAWQYRPALPAGMNRIQAANRTCVETLSTWNSLFMRNRPSLPCSLCIVLWISSAVPTRGQEVQQPESLAGGAVRLNFGTEVEIKSLVDYVSQRVGVRILYDEQVANKKLTIKAPGDIPAHSLLGLLESSLKMKGLMLVDADVEGWKRIVVANKLTEVAPATGPADASRTSAALTEAFVLKYAESQQVDQVIKPFLSQPGANSIALKEPNLLIVTDYVANLAKISRLIELVDRPKPDVVLEFVTLAHMEVATAAQQVTAMISAKSKAQGVKTGSTLVEVAADVRTNRLILIGERKEVEEVKLFISTLDVPLDVVTRSYLLRSVEAERFERMAKQFSGNGNAKWRFSSVTDKNENTVVVTATPEIHAGLKTLQEGLDLPAGESEMPVRFYKLKNITAEEALQTIRSLGGQSNGIRQDTRSAIKTNPARDNSVPVPNQPPSAIGEPPRQITAPLEPINPLLSTTAEINNTGLGSLLGKGQVSADVNSNSLIVVGDPAVQRVYADLISRLDYRRPQVLIQVKIVIVDTTDDYSLGIELGGDTAKISGKRLLAFSSLGLSEVDPVNGNLSLLPGLGFNGSLVDPLGADVVLRALTRHRRARVHSAPQLLVNDNAKGTLSSVAEVPFTSVNASQTVATTSFAGFAEAGTSIDVTPHISDDDHLQLDFVVTLNSFTGAGSQGVPPPRQTNEITSRVTIPDGHTVIVGGLNRSGKGRQVESLPQLERIPFLKWLTRSETNNDERSSLFVFIRPIILRDDKFKDLKFLSDRDLAKAGAEATYPDSQPLFMK